MPLRNLWHAEQVIKNRYTPGNEWYQMAFKTADEFIEESKTIGKVIPDKSRVCVAFDPTPNTALYLLKKRGVRIGEDFDSKMAVNIMNSSGADYLVLNDTTRWFKIFQPFNSKLMTKIYSNNKNIFVYKIRAQSHRP